MSVVVALYINNNHILCKFQYIVKQIVFQKRTKLFQKRTINTKKPLIFTDKWPNTLYEIIKKNSENKLKFNYCTSKKMKYQNINHCISKWYFFRK